MTEPAQAELAPQLPPARIAELLEATARTVEAELHALGEDGARWRPAPGEWCANEVVGHLVEADLRGFAGRIRTLLDEDDPALLGWDQPTVAAARDELDDPGVSCATGAAASTASASVVSPPYNLR